MKVNPEKLQAALADSGMNLKTLAEAAGVSYQTVGRCAHGRGNGSPENIHAVGNALGVKPSWDIS